MRDRVGLKRGIRIGRVAHAVGVADGEQLARGRLGQRGAERERGTLTVGDGGQLADGGRERVTQPDVGVLAECKRLAFAQHNCGVLVEPRAGLGFAERDGRGERGRLAVGQRYIVTRRFGERCGKRSERVCGRDGRAERDRRARDAELLG